MEFSYKFPAVKGIQAKKEYYISMVPLKLLKKLFPSDEDVVQPEFRAQRRINEARIPEIRDYILNNRNNYIFSAISASIDGNFRFINNGELNTGILEIDMDATFLINDGQHRKASIEAALLEDPSLGEETISVVFFKDEGLKHSQQMFTDLNKHAVKTSNSLATLYDNRNEVAIATKAVVSNVKFFNRFTDKERDNLGKNSSNFFTLNNILNANLIILHNMKCTDEDLKFLIEYWNNVADNITEWQDVMEKRMTKVDLRENYIVTLAVTLHALGRLGRYFYDNKDVNYITSLERLKFIDWRRSNTNDWLNRTIRTDGKIMNSQEAVILTCAKIKNLIGLTLDKDEITKEMKLEKINGK